MQRLIALWNTDPSENQSSRTDSRNLHTQTMTSGPRSCVKTSPFRENINLMNKAGRSKRHRGLYWFEERADKFFLEAEDEGPPAKNRSVQTCRMISVNVSKVSRVGEKTGSRRDEREGTTGCRPRGTRSRPRGIPPLTLRRYFRC